jgi:RNA polymerase sigma factor (TIGR02999 family)
VTTTRRLTDPHLITQVLQAVARNEPMAAEELLPLVYDELRRLARARLDRVGPGQTLQATALVHEAWLRVVGDDDPGWDCRAHFFGAAAKAMRNILVEEWRKKSSLRRGGERVRLDEELFGRLGHETPVQEMLILEEALGRLEAFDALKAKVVELRFFTGLTMREVAEVLNLPLTRVEQEWRFARSWLQNEVDAFEPAAGDELEAPR